MKKLFKLLAMSLFITLCVPQLFAMVRTKSVRVLAGVGGADKGSPVPFDGSPDVEVAEALATAAVATTPRVCSVSAPAFGREAVLVRLERHVEDLRKRYELAQRQLADARAKVARSEATVVALETEHARGYRRYEQLGEQLSSRRTSRAYYHGQHQRHEGERAELLQKKNTKKLQHRLDAINLIIEQAVAQISVLDKDIAALSAEQNVLARALNGLCARHKAEASALAMHQKYVEVVAKTLKEKPAVENDFRAIENIARYAHSASPKKELEQNVSIDGLMQELRCIGTESNAAVRALIKKIIGLVCEADRAVTPLTAARDCQMAATELQAIIDRASDDWAPKQRLVFIAYQLAHLTIDYWEDVNALTI